jgi:Carboxypeptidase regulatory-like domain
MCITATIAFALLLQAPASAKASIEGRVVRAGTNDPIARVEVIARREDGSRTLPPVTTDAQGHFVIKDLDPGLYSLGANRNGFAPQTYGQRKPRGPGTELNLSAGQELKDLVFRLIPAGAISGRITDETGEPLMGINVGIEETVYWESGARHFQAAKTATTDDRGEYRVFMLPPGRYYMKAAPFFAGVLEKGLINPNYVDTYYPGVPDTASAAAIDLDPGAEVGGIDLVLRRQQLFSIHGRLVDSRTGKPPVSRPAFELRRRDSGDGVRVGSTDYDPANGTFSLLNVPPGTYWIVASLRMMRVNEQDRLIGATRIARAPVDLSTSDIANVLLQVPPDMSIAGRISMDDGSGVSNVQDLGVNLRMNEPSGAIAGPSEAPVRPDGTFLIENVQPGDYKLWLSPPQWKHYIKAARLDGNDVLNGVQISAAPSEGLELVLGSDTAHVEGTIVDSDHKPVTGVEVVLIPTRERERRDMYRTAITDQRGRFTLLPTVPGEYKLFAWEDFEGFAYMDPDFLRKYEELGTPVNVVPSGASDVEVKLIPASRQ